MDETSKTIVETFSRMMELRQMIRNVGPNDEVGRNPHTKAVIHQITRKEYLNGAHEWYSLEEAEQ